MDFDQAMALLSSLERTVDILTRLGEAFRYEDLEAQVIEVEGIAVRVATPATLYRMKRDTVRALDRQDAEALKERFDLDDESGPAGGGGSCP